MSIFANFLSSRKRRQQNKAAIRNNFLADRDLLLAKRRLEDSTVSHKRRLEDWEMQQNLNRALELCDAN